MTVALDFVQVILTFVNEPITLTKISIIMSKSTSQEITSCNGQNIVTLPAYSKINQNIVNQLDDLLSEVELKKVKHSLTKLFFEYINLNVDYIEALPEDLGDTANDLYFLYNFLTNIDNELNATE